MRFFVAFAITLLIYALLIWLFVTQFSKVEIHPQHADKHIIKIDIRNIPLPVKPTPPPSKKKVTKTPVIKKTIIKEPIIKKPIEKKISKKKVVKKKKKLIKKKKYVHKKKIIKKRKKKVVKKKKKIIKNKKKINKKRIHKKRIHKKKKVVKKTIIQEEKTEATKRYEEEMIYIPNPLVKPRTKTKTEVAKKKSNDLASFLSTPSSNRPSHAYPNPKIKKLYGSSFHKMTPTQKKFIKNNLDTIQQITQRTLTRRGYPEGAAQTGQQGTNIVSFDLHPNGDISNLRLKRRIGYTSLDENTLSLIRVAYKDYPYPSSTTRIVFYVSYSIYGY